MLMPTNAAEALCAYQLQAKPSEFAGVKTALLRFVVPAWSSTDPYGRKMTAQDRQTALRFLADVSLVQLQNALDTQLTVFERLHVGKHSRAVYRSYLKRFLEWCREQDWMPDASFSDPVQSASKTISVHQFKRPNGKGLKVRSKVTGRQQKAAYALGAVSGDIISPKLQQQLDAFDQFAQAQLKLRPYPLQISKTLLLQYLGWLHRYEGVPLNELRLETLVTVVPLKQRLADFTHTSGEPDPLAYAAAKAMAMESAEREGRKTIKLIERYLNFVDGALGTYVEIIKTVTRVAKFLYDSQTNAILYDYYEDIPVIQQLRQLAADLKRARQGEPAQVPYERKSVAWEQALTVLFELKRLADLDVRYAKDASKQDGYRVQPRRAKGIGMSYQQFLSLGFFMVIPPDRSRTFYELELDRTLRWGYFQDGLFVAIEDREDPSAAWYIHLQAEDYKTGAAHGEYWGKVLNAEFADGTCFYDYIQRWLTEFRPLFQPEHPFFFVQRNGKPLLKNALYARLRYFFQKLVAVPVTPKELRRMYVTQLYAEGASEAEKEAAACAMHHSRKMQASVYNQLDQIRMTAPIYTFNEQAFSDFLKQKPDDA